VKAGAGARRRVVLASRNAHKVREIEALLAEAGLGWELVGVDEVAPGVELREDEETFEGNALAKARQAAVVSGGLAAIADDSGIEVDALGGAPGVRSARYAGEPCDDGRNNAKLLRELAGVPAEKRTARYRCAAAFVDGGREVVREGACEGRLLEVGRGAGGFGYDPLFLVEDLGRTMAEISMGEKATISHRAAAFRALAAALRG
jgi:XTP/dITP diphosphohydrolase